MIFFSRYSCASRTVAGCVTALLAVLVGFADDSFLQGRGRRGATARMVRVGTQRLESTEAIAHAVDEPILASHGDPLLPYRSPSVSAARHMPVPALPAERVRVVPHDAGTRLVEHPERATVLHRTHLPAQGRAPPTR